MLELYVDRLKFYCYVNEAKNEVYIEYKRPVSAFKPL